MPIIKRYPNRKLYDTQTKRYINLDDVAEMIRRGEEIQVIDHASGKDITALTYSQIILEQEKKSGGFLPHTLLSELIQAGGNRLSKIQHRLAVSSGFRRLVDGEIERRMDILIQRDKIDAQRGQDLLGDLIEAGTSSDERLSQESEFEPLEMEQLLEKLQIPTRKNIRDLMDQVDALIVQLDELDLEN
jgi:polyhydroxyalkanoate synthesis repressor PhaR